MERLDEFRDLEDFEQGFFQNLMGNTLSFIDVSNRMKESLEEGDYAATVYQIGRLFRRTFDFKPMKSSSGPEYTLKQGRDQPNTSIDTEESSKPKVKTRNSLINEFDFETQ